MVIEGVDPSDATMDDWDITDDGPRLCRAVHEPTGEVCLLPEHHEHWHFQHSGEQGFWEP